MIVIYKNELHISDVTIMENTLLKVFLHANNTTGYASICVYLPRYSLFLFAFFVVIV